MPKYTESQLCTFLSFSGTWYTVNLNVKENYTHRNYTIESMALKKLHCLIN